MVFQERLCQTGMLSSLPSLEGVVCGFGDRVGLHHSLSSVGRWTDGQMGRVNKILEEMLRMYMMHQQRIWEEYLPLVEFAYNDGDQESLRMSPFEALYGRSCNIPISWIDPMNKVLIVLDMLANMEQKM